MKKARTAFFNILLDSLRMRYGMKETVTILCVDDEANVLKALKRIFLDEDYQVLTASSGSEALSLLAGHQPIQVVLSDYRMPEMDGIAFFKEVHDRWPDTIRVVLSGYADTATVVAAINEGQIYKFIPKPWNDEELKVTIAKAVERYFLIKANRELTEELRRANAELSRNAEQLEAMVAQRTEELMFQNRALRNSQVILNVMPVGVLGFDRHGMLAQRNRFAEEAFGDFRVSCLGESASEVLPPEWLALLAEARPGVVLSRSLPIGDKHYCIRVAMIDEISGQAGTVMVFGSGVCGMMDSTRMPEADGGGK